MLWEFSVIDFLINAFSSIVLVLIFWTIIRWVFGFGNRPMYAEKPKMTPARTAGLVFVLALIWGLGMLIIVPTIRAN